MVFMEETDDLNQFHTMITCNCAYTLDSFFMDTMASKVWILNFPNCGVFTWE